MASVYEIITEKIIEKLEAGIIPWRKPWKTYATKSGKINMVLQKNYITKKPYNGINQWLLDSEGKSNYWLTFKQIQSLKNCHLKAGSKSEIICFFTIIDPKEKDDDRKFVLKYYRVFNASDVNGLENVTAENMPVFEDEKPEEEVFSSIDAAENIIKNWTDKPEIEHGEAQAYYMPTADYINMPKKAAFIKPEGYYTTLFHESVHATGHESRLNRNLSGKFSNRDELYSKEELVAEFGASFLCGVCGIVQETLENSVAYIQSWSRALKNDKRMIVFAAAQGEKAAKYILGENFTTEPEEKGGE